MDDIQDTFKRIRQHTPVMELGNNFEERVFAKIKRKKRQRKVIASVALGAVFIGALFIAQGTLFQSGPEPQKPMFAQTNRDFRPEKEEVAVVEDVVFASSDARSTYVIEQVSYTPNNTTL